MFQTLSRFVLAALLMFSFVAGTGGTAFAQSRKQTPQTTNEKKNKRPDQSQSGEPISEEDRQATAADEVVKIKTNIVNVDTVVYNKKSGQVVPNLTAANFAVFEEGVKQEITNFSSPEAPITVSVVVEFSKLSSYLGARLGGGFEPGKMEVVRPAALFLTQFIRPPDDYASLIAFDIRPTPITDFTNDPRRIQQAVTLLARNNPAFSENNLFDAIKFTLVGGKGDSVVLDDSKESKAEYGGMVDVQAKRRAVILITSGIDTFSKVNYDQTQKIIQKAGVPIHIIGTGNFFYKMFENQLGATDSIAGAPGRLTFLQADNTLKTFAKQSGGSYYPVTFPGDVPGALQGINALLRNQYSIAYEPAEAKPDAKGKIKKRKLEVKVDVDKDGQFDDKVYEVRHRQFYVPDNTTEK